MKLDEDIYGIEYESGNGAIFPDRVSWACRYLNNCKFIDKPKRGYFQITKLGISFLDKTNDEIKKYIKENYESKHKRDKKENSNENQKNNINDLNPSDLIDIAFKEIKDE